MSSTVQNIGWLHFPPGAEIERYLNRHPLATWDQEIIGISTVVANAFSNLAMFAVEVREKVLFALESLKKELPIPESNIEILCDTLAQQLFDCASGKQFSQEETVPPIYDT